MRTKEKRKDRIVHFGKSALNENEMKLKRDINSEMIVISAKDIKFFDNRRVSVSTSARCINVRCKCDWVKTRLYNCFIALFGKWRETKGNKSGSVLSCFCIYVVVFHKY